MNIQAIFFHMFVKRGFFGLLAFAWGFMLGGSVLMTAFTYGLAFAGLSRYAVMLSQIAALVMLLPVAWVVMELEYEKKSVTSAKTFGAAFLVSSFFGAIMPVMFFIGAFVTWGEAFRRKAILTYDKPLPRRGGLTGFLQELMEGSFLRLAH